jgi:hypothetical protein
VVHQIRDDSFVVDPCRRQLELRFGGVERHVAASGWSIGDRDRRAAARTDVQDLDAIPESAARTSVEGRAESLGVSGRQLPAQRVAKRAPRPATTVLMTSPQLLPGITRVARVNALSCRSHVRGDAHGY